MKKPWLAALLNILPVPIGLGYLYLGRPHRFLARASLASTSSIGRARSIRTTRSLMMRVGITHLRVFVGLAFLWRHDVYKVMSLYPIGVRVHPCQEAGLADPPRLRELANSRFWHVAGLTHHTLTDRLNRAGSSITL